MGMFFFFLGASQGKKDKNQRKKEKNQHYDDKKGNIDWDNQSEHQGPFHIPFLP